MFDLQYLLREMLTDQLLEQRSLQTIDALSDEQEDALLLLSQELYNDEIPKSAKLRLESMEHQEDIEKYLAKKLQKAGVFLSMIP